MKSFSNRLLAPLLPLLLAQCSSMESVLLPRTEVVYALGSLEGFPSPLSSRLQPACAALTFASDSFLVSGKHRIPLDQLAEQLQQDPERIFIVGYAPPDLPPDYARGLSERRAQAVRSYLIETGVEAGLMQTLGLGNDFTPSGPASDSVVVYRTTEAPLREIHTEEKPSTSAGTPVAMR